MNNRTVRDVKSFVQLPVVDLSEIKMHPGCILCSATKYQSLIFYTELDGTIIHIEKLIGEEYTRRQAAYYWAKRHIEQITIRSSMVEVNVEKVTTQILKGIIKNGKTGIGTKMPQVEPSFG